MRTADEHRRWRELLGAYTMGALPPAEVVALRAHLDGCEGCRQEEAELREVAELLGEADPDALGPVHPPPWLAERVVDAVAEQRARHTRRRRAVAALGAVAAAVVALVVGVGLLGDGAEHEGDEPVPLAITLVPAGVDAHAAVEVRPWGTTVHLEASGLQAGLVYQAWLEQPDGTRTSAGTFRPGAARSIDCYLTAAITPGEASAFGISSEGVTLLRADIT
jgi:anti-sigma factor RsiW